MRARTTTYRGRVDRPADVNPVLWDEALHEAGHAVAALLLGRAVIRVVLPARGGGWVESEFRPGSFWCEKTAFVSASGLAAVRSRGKRSARMSPDDRRNITNAVPVKDAPDVYVAWAETLFRQPGPAQVLFMAARFLCDRHGTEIDGSDLFAALPIRDEDMTLAEELVELAAEETEHPRGLPGGESSASDRKARRSGEAAGMPHGGTHAVL